MPLHYISYHYARFCYQQGHFELCNNVCVGIFAYFTEPTGIKDQSLDNKTMSLFMFRLREGYIKHSSLLELEGVAYTFFYYMKCLAVIKQSDYDEFKGHNIVLKQKNILKLLNIAMLGLEIAIHIRSYALIKLFITELYNTMLTFLQQKNKPVILTNILVRMNIAINIIPSDLWDQNLRIISSLIDYNFIQLLVVNNESEIFKKVLVQEIGLPRKKYNIFSYKYLKRDDKKKVDKNKTSEVEYIEAQSPLIKEFEKEIYEFDEYLIANFDFSEQMRAKVLQYFSLLDKFVGVPEIAPELEKRKKELTEILDIWEGFKLESLKYLQKFLTTNKENEKYYEISSKLLKRAIEQKNPLVDLIKISENEIIIKEIDTSFISGIFNQKVNFIKNDVVYLMKLRIKENLDIVEKEIPVEDREAIRDAVESKFFGKAIEQELKVPYDSMSLNETLLLKEKYFWIADLLYNKTLVLFLDYLSSSKDLLNYDCNNFMLNYKLVDLLKIKDEENIKTLRTVNKNGNNLDIGRDVRLKKVHKIVERIAFTSLFISELNFYSVFDNIMALTYNLFTYDMLVPSDTTEIYQYLVALADCAIKRLEYLKTGGDGYIQTDYERELELLKQRISDPNIKGQCNFNLSKRHQSESKQTVDEEKVIEYFESKINLDIYIEFLCFTIQAVYYSSKWNILADLVIKFNKITNDTFCEFSLPFLNEAQSNLYEKSLLNCQSKQKEMDEKVAVYENWKNGRKKNKRQQMITGEVPQEQIDFERDYTRLSKELFILNSISNLFKSDKEKSELSYKALINDSNNALKAVNSCRKLFEKYQIEVLTIDEVKGKAIETFAKNLISLQLKTVQILKKRQENYLLIQILYELSKVYYSLKDFKNAEMYFIESLDTVFQKLYSLKDFKNLLNESIDKYGVNQMLYAICALHKLSKFCYDNDLSQQRECALMASEISKNIITAYLPNPSVLTAAQRLGEINKNLNLFKTSDNVNPADLLESLLELCEVNMAYNNFDKCIHMLWICEFVACDVVKSIYYTHKARILLTFCLAELGFISESMQIFYKIMKKFDLPNFLQNSIFIEKSTGKFANLQKEFKFNNSQLPDFTKNIEAVNFINKMQIDLELKNQLGCNLFNELIFARIIINLKVFEKENYLNYLEKSDIRQDNLIRIEKELRDLLLTVALSEEIIMLSNLGEAGKKKLDELAASRKIISDEITNFYLNRFNRHFNDLRKDRLDLMSRVRLTIAYVYNIQGLYLTGSSVLLKAIDNSKKYAAGLISGIETGEDYLVDFKLPEGNQKGGGTKPGAGNTKTNSDRKLASRKGLPVIEDSKQKDVVTDYSTIKTDYRKHSNALYLIKLLNQYLSNTFKMNRLNDCKSIIEQLCSNCKELNDCFYLQRCIELSILIDIHEANYSSIPSKHEMIKKLQNPNLTDIEHALFLCNYSEFLYAAEKPIDAIAYISEGRKILWLKMAEMNFLIKSENYNNNCKKEIDKNLKQIITEREALYITAGNNKPKQAIDVKKGEKTEVQPINFESVSNADKNLYENSNGDINNTFEGENVYFKFTELLCRTDIKFILYILNNNQVRDFDALKETLNDIELLCNKILYPHNGIKSSIFYLKGKINKLQFLNSLNNFLKEFEAIKKKNLIEVISDKILATFSNNYNEICITKWQGLLTTAKENFEKSVFQLKGDFYFLENGLNLYTFLEELSDTLLLLSEYRPNYNMKFADMEAIVTKIQSIIKIGNYIYKDNIEPSSPRESDTLVKTESVNWQSEKLKKEKILVKNYIRSAIHYSELGAKVLGFKKLINDNLHELALGNITDVSKCSRDLLSQVLENDYLNKKMNKLYLTNVQIKPSIDGVDLLNLMKSMIRELDCFTFTNDETVRNLSKLHKFLRVNFSNYLSKCFIDIVPPQEINTTNEATVEVVKKDQIICLYVKGEFIYVLGTNNLNNTEYCNKRVPFNKAVLVSLNKRFFDLRSKVKQVLLISEQRKKRDFKYLQIEYENLVGEFTKEFLKQRENVKQLPEAYEVSLENIEFWMNVTQGNIFNIVNAKFNTYLHELNKILMT
jgi:hypothetical protein